MEGITEVRPNVDTQPEFGTALAEAKAAGVSVLFLLCHVGRDSLPQEQKDKVEFLCNECCWVGCRDRKRCYENVSRKNLGEACPDHICTAPGAEEGYRFSKAMENPEFIGIGDIQDVYMPMGFSNFKIEGRGLGSALVLEFLLHYMTKPEYQLYVREAIYLDNMLDLF